MNNSTWQKAKQLFEQARSLPPEERSSYLDSECGGDDALRAEVEKLLGAYDSDFLEDTILGAAEALAEPHLPIGQEIGRYRIREMIGTGGMGQVFLADDMELDRPVAFKVLHRDVAEDDERVRRFIQEARAASALNHPNILTIHEIGSFESARFIVSEYIDGDTLRQRMHQGLNAAESVEIACQVAAALQAAHSAGIVHRDIKPENVMIRRDGLVKVLDFGLAKLTEADDRPIDPEAVATSPVLTSPGLVMGTVAYMSPEQARGQTVDARTDLWSLGVVLHEMLTGRSPFHGGSVTELVSSILSTDSTPANIDSLPPELIPICRKALTKEKEKRYRSAHDLLNDLKGEKKRMEYAIQQTPFISASSTDELKTQLIRRRPTLSAEYIAAGIKKHKYATIISAVLIGFLGVGFAVYNFNGAEGPISDSLAIGGMTKEDDLRISRLPISGGTEEAAISPDGNYIAYVAGVGNTQTSIHLLNLATSSDREIVPRDSKAKHHDLSFSPDSRDVYYLRNTPDNEEIFRVSTNGGTPTKIADQTDGGGSVSPDGKLIAFNREVNQNRDGETLVIANADGSNERVLVHTLGDQPWIYCGGVPAWSPDGKSIACWIAKREGNSQWGEVYAFNVLDGSRRLLTEKKWTNISMAAYTPDGNLLLAAQERSESAQMPRQIWLITRDGSTRALTSGLIGYDGLSITKKGDAIVTRQTGMRRDLWALSIKEPARALQVTSSGEVATGFDWLPDGRMVVGSAASGNPELWLVKPDGSGREQLTRDSGQSGHPAVSPEGRYIVFTSSSRSDGTPHLFRINTDGTNLTQLTAGFGEVLARFSKDGKFIYFLARIDPAGGQLKAIKRIAVTGGEAEQVAIAPEGWVFTSVDVSRVDGRLAYGLFRRRDTSPEVGVLGRWRLEHQVGILQPKGGAVPQILPVPPNLSANQIRWTPDGKSIAMGDRGEQLGPGIDIWTFPISRNGKPKRITDFRTPPTFGFAWSGDGKQLLVSRGTAINDPVIIRNNKGN